MFVICIKDVFFFQKNKCIPKVRENYKVVLNLMPILFPKYTEYKFCAKLNVFTVIQVCITVFQMVSFNKGFVINYHKLLQQNYVPFLQLVQLFIFQFYMQIR